MACAVGLIVGKNNNTEIDPRNKQIVAVYEAYVVYARKRGGMPLSYEEWLISVKGDQGEKGETGAQGKSAYEIFKEYYPEYTGTEKEWITAVASGNVCALFGHDYDDGVITTQPTKLTNGLKTFTCKKCKTTYTVNIPKLEVAEARYTRLTA